MQNGIGGLIAVIVLLGPLVAFPCWAMWMKRSRVRKGAD